MFMRQGIVWAALNLVLLGIQPCASQARPPDLPLDPRIVCPEGPDTSPRPEPKGTGPVADKQAEQPKMAPEPTYGELLKSAHIAFDNGDLDTAEWLARAATEVRPIRTSPSCDTPERLLARIQAEGNRRARLGTDRKVGLITCWGYVVNKEYRDMLNSTQPLDLPPLTPPSLEAYRNCPRAITPSNPGTTIFYVDPPPRNLVLREE